MKNSKISVFALLFFAITMSCEAVYAQKDVSKEIMKANENFMKLFAAGDVDKFITVYTDDARLLPPGSPVVTGKENLKVLWQGMMDSDITVKLRTTSAIGYGKMAVEEGVVDILEDDEVVDQLKYIIIWKKVKGDWKMYQDMWNSATPGE